MDAQLQRQIGHIDHFLCERLDAFIIVGVMTNGEPVRVCRYHTQKDKDIVDALLMDTVEAGGTKAILEASEEN